MGRIRKIPKMHMRDFLFFTKVKKFIMVSYGKKRKMVMGYKLISKTTQFISVIISKGRKKGYSQL